MAGFWGKRKQEQEAQDAADTDLARRAGSALVRADERIRVTSDELEFARMELGDSSVKALEDGVKAVKTHLREAYQLNQLNFDEIPDTKEEVRTRNARIVQLCEWADKVLDERTAALADRVAFARRAPQVLAQVRTDIEALARRIPNAKQTVERLSARYDESAVREVAASADEVSSLLSFAEHSADVSARRREAKQNEEANLALETATEAVRRATSMLDGIEDYELEALRAESTLAAVIADSRGDLVNARHAPRVAAVTQAAGALETALAAIPAPGTRSNPFAELTNLREANAALDAAIAKAVERAARPLPSIATVQHQLAAADGHLGVARNLINGHRGWIGADARTRLAEAERIREGLDAQITSEDTREMTLVQARRVADLATNAISLAQRDIDSSRPVNRNQGGGDGQMWGTILGGVVLGSILGDIFD